MRVCHLLYLIFDNTYIYTIYFEMIDEQETDVRDRNETINDDAGDETEQVEMSFDEEVHGFPDEYAVFENIPTNREILGSDEATLPDRLEAIIAFLGSEEGLDIYQLTAFRVMKGPKPCSEFHYFGYVTDIMKVIVCVSTQIISLIMLGKYIFESRDKDFCSMNDDSIAEKLVAGCYCAFLGTILFSYYLRIVDSPSFYIYTSYEEEQYSWISSYWLHFGRLLNAFILLACITLSFFIILFADNTLDLILNAIALLFIAEIDNEVVDMLDYEKLCNYFEYIQDQSKKYTNGDEYLEAFFRRKPLNKCFVTFVEIISIIIDKSVYILIVLTPILVIAMIICY